MSGKKPKKKPGKNKVFSVIDGISTEDMSKEQLEEHVKRLLEELEKERKERNYFQLERDQINAYYEITKTQLEQKNSELRNKERELEESVEKHDTELKVYKQKVKHLLYEHQNNMSELKAKNMIALKLASDEHNDDEKELWKQKQALLVVNNERQMQHEMAMKQLELKHDEFVTNLRNQYHQEVEDLEKKFESKVKSLREELDLKRKTEVHAIEERKNLQLDGLIKNHEKAFSDMKNYYNDITVNNLALINTLKEEIEELKKKEGRSEEEKKKVMSENKQLVEPLQKATEDLRELKRKLTNYEKDKLSLANTITRLKKTEEHLKKSEFKFEVLRQKCEKIELERDELLRKFEQAIWTVQQKTSLKNTLLEKKLEAINESLEKKEIQLNEVLSASNIDPTTVGVVTKKLDDLLSSKNKTIKLLEFELAKACKAHDDVLRVYTSKLRQFGVPTEELGFEPLQSSVLIKQPIGKGPAGLVSASS